MLKVSNISFQYTPKKEILSNISFTLNAGQHLCIMGESGSGKSTLLKAVYGLLDLKDGTVFWKDQRGLRAFFSSGSWDGASLNMLRKILI